MNVCVFVQLYVCLKLCVCTNVCVQLCMCIIVCIQMCVCVCLKLCVCQLSVYNCVCVSIVCVQMCVFTNPCVHFNATTVSQTNKTSEKSNAKVGKDKVKVEKKEEQEVVVKVDEVAKEEEVKVKVQDEVEDEVVAEDHDAVKLAANGAKVLFQV